jgi:hypothetical protein
MVQSPEFFSFVTEGRLAGHNSKAVLVTMQKTLDKFRVVSILSVTLTTLKQLEYSGAPWRHAKDIPEQVRFMIRDFEESKIGKILREIWKEDEEALWNSSSGIIN